MIIDKAKLKALVEQGSLPPIITALIEEIERLEGSVQSLIQMERNTGNRAIEYAGKCDQLHAEVAGLKTGYEAYERVNAELKAEVEKLRNALIGTHREAFETYFRCCAIANGKDEAWASKNLERAEDGTYMRAKAYDGWCYWMAAKDFAAETILKEGR